MHEFLAMNAAFAHPAPTQKALCEGAKHHLKSNGWSYRSAAPVLGVNYVHLAHVLNGQRQSRRLLSAVLQLGPKKRPTCNP